MADDPACKNCGGPLLPRRGGGTYGGGGKPQVHCSDRCRRQWARKQLVERARASRPDKCAECASVIDQPERGAPRRFCSATCKRRFHNRRSARARTPAPAPSERQCPRCGTKFTPQRRHGVYCSKACAQSVWARSQSGLSPIACVVCGQVFKPSRVTQRYCSTPCRNRHWMKTKQRRKRQLAPGDYADRDVFIRDGWTCHLCGEDIDPEAKWPDRRCATIDHILPVSLGGTDDLSNVAAAHWHCNHTKLANI